MQERNRKNQTCRQKEKSEDKKIKDRKNDCKRRQDLRRKLKEAKQIRGSKEPENDTDEPQVKCDMADFLSTTVARKRRNDDSL